MAHINQNFLKLPGGYLFPEIGRRVRAFSAQNPPMPLIRLGIGDVTQPLAPAVVDAMVKASKEMGVKETFRGYCDAELWVAAGAKSDCGNIGDIFSADNVVAVCDPVYPVYVDTNAMAGRAGDHDGEKWDSLIYLPCTAENGFFPDLPTNKVPDLIYICSPNNPTGTAATKEQLKVWVDYANAHGSIILFDSAYEAFISEEGVPHSIFEVEGAKTCAIEFRSFSKSAGFTGTRCAYTVIPKALEREGASLNPVEPQAGYQVQRRTLCDPASGGGGAQPRGQGPDQGCHQLLPEQRQGHPGRADRRRADGIWRGERPLFVGENTRQHPFLGLLRSVAEESLRGHHPRRGLWPQRGRVHPGHCLW